ncbi:hypothetical protein [Psychrobacter sp.]|uniref:hypothetical protein n=1 Tax=Psychrobacter sp. TaxID=56811 RepID=UPI002FDA2BE2
MIAKIKGYLNTLKEVNFNDTSKLIKPCDVLLFGHDVNRGIALNNKAYSPLLDSIRDEFERKGFSCITVAHPWSRIVGKKGYGDPIAINKSYFISRIVSRLTSKLGYEPTLKLYEGIIKKARPKLIITIGCNDFLCEAARNLEVFHAELLHGIGYNPIPWNWDKKEKKSLPQCILSLDEVSTQTFSELEKYGVIVKEIVHPFLRRFESKCINNLPQEWLAPNKKNEYEKEVLVSLQWGYTSGVDELDCFKGFLSNGLFYDELEDIIRETNKNVFWHFRFHPVQYLQIKKYKKLFDFMDGFVNKHKNCGWKESTYIPLPSILSRCSGHITMSSMTTYEAAYLGVPTLALCPSLRETGIYEEFFDDLVVNGYVRKGVLQIDSTLKWISNVEKLEPMLNTLKVNESIQDTIGWLLSQEKIN